MPLSSSNPSATLQNLPKALTRSSLRLSPPAHGSDQKTLFPFPSPTITELPHDYRLAIYWHRQAGRWGIKKILPVSWCLLPSQDLEHLLRNPLLQPDTNCPPGSSESSLHPKKCKPAHPRGIRDPFKVHSRIGFSSPNTVHLTLADRHHLQSREARETLIFAVQVGWRSCRQQVVGPISWDPKSSSMSSNTTPSSTLLHHPNLV